MQSWIVLVLAGACAAAQPSAPSSVSLSQAQSELFAARYQKAAELYTQVLAQDPGQADAGYGLVRALIKAHRSKDAYAAAAEALRRNPAAPAALAAAGLAAYRQGDLPSAELRFREALRLNPDDPGALKGLASIYSALSKPKSARDLLLRAYHDSPADPDLMLAYANTLKGSGHIAALERVLPILDPDTEGARNLRIHIADDRAMRGRKARQLTSSYAARRIKLIELLDGPSHPRGLGLQVELNGRQKAKLILDTGASGIALSPKIAAKAGLEILGEESSEAKGLGDEAAQAARRYLAAELRAGDVVFANYPVEVFRGAQSAGNYDGLIGADVFAQFIVSIDFRRLELSLEPRPDYDPAAAGEPVDAGPPAPGFYRFFKFGDHVAIPTRINEGQPSLFMIDSGSSANLLDTETARRSAAVTGDRAIVRGIQGKVDHTSRADRVSLIFAGFRQDNSSVIAISLDKMSDSLGTAFGGILGMPVLNQLKLTIDYPEGTARFEYRR